MPAVKMTLEEAALLVHHARSGRELFGIDDTKSIKLYQQLQFVTHPDHNPGVRQAEDLYKLIQILWSQRNDPLSPPIVSPTRKYQSHKIIGVGDIADLHLCTNLTSSDEEGEGEYALKISRVLGGEVLLKNEADKVSKIIKLAGDKSYRKYFPELIESFPVKDKFQKHVNVFAHNPGYFDLEQVHMKHPALDGRHIAWIFKRLLTAIGFAHQAGVVHTAILPPHIRIYPGMAGQKDDKAHALMLVGWGHAINSGEKVATISSRFRSWYPPEVLAKKAVFAETDIYLAAKCMVYLAGGDLTTNETPDLPKQMSRFIKSLLVEGQKMRPSEAWNLLEDFTDLLKALYGPPKFHNLVMA